MYNNLTLYYLEQMGIVPWIKKDTSAHNSVKLIILLSEDPSKTAQSLFKKILAYINIATENLLIMKFHEEITAQLEKYNPQAILTFGVNIKELNLTYPAQEGLSLNNLLAYPSYKKALFQKINLLKVFI